jgi:hypothetical protein
MILEDTGLLLRICARYLIGVAAIGAAFVLLCGAAAYVLLNAADGARDNLALVLRFPSLGWFAIFAVGCWLAFRLQDYLDRRSMTRAAARTLA